MSKLIHIASDIAEDLLTEGFHTITNNAFCINATLNNDTIKFLKAYDNLKVDKYVLNDIGKPCRKRRYGSFTFDIKKNILSSNEHKTFFQSKKVNKAYGGIERDFAPIENDTLNNQFLQELIKADFTKFPKLDKNLSQKWFVGVQMFRIEATKDFKGEATPEGIHQDEHHFVVQHMINKKNVKGGVSSIYNLDQEKIVSLTLNNFLDTCYVKDEKVMHSVSSIECETDNEIAIRDMLILDFELME